MTKEFKTEKEELTYLREKERVHVAIKDFLLYLIEWIIRISIGYAVFSLAIIGVKTVSDPRIIPQVQWIIWAIAVFWLMGIGFSPFETSTGKAIEWAMPLLTKWKRQFQASSEAWVKAREDSG